MVLSVFCIGYIIYQRREIKRLHNRWDDVFNAKIESERRWAGLCNHYLEKIDELTAEQKDVK
jgi:hypothetical protein